MGGMDPGPPGRLERDRAGRDHAGIQGFVPPGDRPDEGPEQDPSQGGDAEHQAGAGQPPVARWRRGVGGRSLDPFAGRFSADEAQEAADVRAQREVEHPRERTESAGADPHVPFGGAKKSGYGPKEQGAAAKEFFTHTTTVYLRGGTAGV